MATIVHTVKLAAKSQDALGEIRKFQNAVIGVEKTVAAMERNLSGGKSLQAAHNWTAAVAKLGGATDGLARSEHILAGASKLTAAEKARVNSAVTEAIAKYTALGKTAPTAMLELEKATRKAEQPTHGLTTRMVALGTAIGTFIGNAVWAGLKRLGSALLDMATNGMKLAPVVGSFDKLTASVGQSGSEMLQVTKSATKGLISDLDIMAAANKAILLGLPITSQEMGVLGATAITLGKAMKVGPTQAMEDLITALGRGSPLILDNLGLTVKVGEANEKYAKQIGKSVSELTEAEKKLAFYNAAMEVAKKRVEELGGVQLNLVDQFTRIKTSIRDTTDALGIAVSMSPGLALLVGELADKLDIAFGGNRVARIKDLVLWVDSLALALVDLAQTGLSAAGLLGRAWAVPRVIVLTTASAVSSLALAFLNLVAMAAELSAKVPGIGGQFQGVAWKARSLADEMRGVQQSFHDQSREAIDAVSGNSDYQKSLDKVSRDLDKLSFRLAAAAIKGASEAAILDRLTNSTDRSGDAAERAAGKWAKYAYSVDAAIRAGQFGAAVPDTPPAGYFTYSHIGRAPGVVPIDLPSWSGQHYGNLNTPPPSWTAGFTGTGGIPSQFTRPDLLNTPPGGSRWLESAFAGLPGAILGAVQGGGSVSGAIGGSLASGLLSGSVVNSIKTGLSGVLGKTLGGALGSIVPGLGTLLGSGLGKLFGGLFGKSKGWQADRDADKQLDVLRSGLLDTYGSLDKIRELGQQVGVDLAGAWGDRSVKGLEHFNRLLDEFKEKLAIKEEIDAMQAEVDRLRQSQVPTWDQVREAADRYGMSVDGLGQKIQQLNVTARATQIINDFELLTKAGASAETIARGMQKELNKLVQDSIKWGSALPANMQPVIESLIKQGLLFDAAGNKITNVSQLKWGAPVESEADKINKAIQSLIDKIEALVKKLSGVDGTTVDVGVNYHARNFPPPDATPNGNPDYGFAGGFVTRHGIQYLAAGNVVRPVMWQPLGTDTVPAMLTPGEGVLSRRGMNALGALNRGEVPVVGGSDRALLEEVKGLRGDMRSLRTALPNAVRDTILLAAGGRR